MAIHDLVRAELAAWPAFAGTTQTLRLRDADFEFAAELVALDSLACAFSGFALTADALAAAGVDQLKEVAERLSKRLTYLLEPIAPMEVDRDQCIVQLRSNPPQRGESGTSYYELLVRRPGEMSLCRYEAAFGAARQPVPAHVTREVFIRLIGDFVDATKG